MVKSIRRDARGSETLMPVLIFVGVFMAIIVVSIASVQTFFVDVENNATYDGQTDAADLNSGIPSTWCEPLAGVNVTSNYTINRYDYFDDGDEKDARIIFWDNETENRDERLQVNVIENNELFGGSWLTPSDSYRAIYEDFVVVAQEYGWWGVREVFISYETIMSNAGETNISYTPFVINEYSYSLVITMPENVTGDTFELYMYYSDYNLRIGKLPFSGWSDYGNQTVWGTLKQMMTMDLPDTHPIIDFLIAIPIWTALIFTFFTIVARLIPFVSGG